MSITLVAALTLSDGKPDTQNFFKEVVSNATSIQGLIDLISTKFELGEGSMRIWYADPLDQAYTLMEDNIPKGTPLANLFSQTSLAVLVEQQDGDNWLRKQWPCPSCTFDNDYSEERCMMCYVFNSEDIFWADAEVQMGSVPEVPDDPELGAQQPADEDATEMDDVNLEDSPYAEQAENLAAITAKPLAECITALEQAKGNAEIACNLLMMDEKKEEEEPVEDEEDDEPVPADFNLPLERVGKRITKVQNRFFKGDRMVGFEDCALAVRGAANLIAAGRGEEAREFVELMLAQAIDIMLKQAVPCRGQYEAWLEVIMVSGMRCLAWTLTADGGGSLAYIDTIASLLKADHPFYAGQRNIMNQRTTGHPECRLKCMRVLGEGDVDGYMLLLQLLLSDDWVGAPSAGKILTIFDMARNAKVLNKQFIAKIVTDFTARMELLSEDDTQLRLKKNETALEPVFFKLENLGGGRKGSVVPPFWLEKVDLKYLLSNNLQQRLFAVGEFNWWANNRANTNVKGRYMTNARYVSWLCEKGVVEEMFDIERMHKEIIARARALLIYLAGQRRVKTAGALPDAHISMMWENSLERAELVVTEIQKLLVAISAQLPPDAINHLLSVVGQSLTADGGCHYPKVVALLVRFGKSAHALMKPEVIGAALRLLWDTIWDDRATAGGDSDTLVTLFTTVLSSKYGDAHRANYLAACAQRIQDSVQAPLPGDGDAAGEEAAASSSGGVGTLLAFNLLQKLLGSASFAAAQAIGQLDERYGGILALLLQELVRFVATAKGSGGGSGKAYLGQVRTRLAFLRFVLSESELLLGAEQLQTVWDTLSSDAEREALFSWLSTVGFPKHASRQAFLPEVRLQAFNDLICGGVEPCSLGPRGYDCFYAYFIGLNDREVHLFNGDTINHVSERALLGKQRLWRLVLEGSDDISARAAQLLLTLYQKLSRYLVEAEVASSFATIFSKLQQAQAEAEAAEAEAGGDASGAHVTMERCIALLNSFLDVSEGSSDVRTHGAGGRGYQVVVNVAVAENHFHPKQALALRLHSKETLASLRRKVYGKVEKPPLSLVLSLGGQPLCGEQRTMAQLGITDGATVACVRDNVHAPREALSRTGQSPWEVLAGSEEYAATVFSLLDTVRSPRVQCVIWDFLMSLPTNARLQAVFTDPVRLLNVDWERQFLSAPYSKAVYILQLVDSLLLPSDNKDLETAARWRRNFLLSGGFPHVLQFLMNHPPVPGTAAQQAEAGMAGLVIRQAGLGVALRIVKFCVLGSLLSQEQTEEQRQNEAAAAQAVSEARTSSPQQQTDGAPLPQAESKGGDAQAATAAVTGEVESKGEEDATDPPKGEESAAAAPPAPEVHPALMRSFSDASSDVISADLRYSELLEKLVRIMQQQQQASDAAAAGDGSGSGSDGSDDPADAAERIMNALYIVEGIVRSDTGHLDTLLAIAADDNSLIRMLLYNGSDRIRGKVAALLSAMWATSQTAFTRVFALIAGELSGLSAANPASLNCGEYFGLLETMVKGGKGKGLVDGPRLLTDLLQLLRSYPRQSGGGGSEKQSALVGYLRLLAVLLNGDSELQQQLGSEDGSGSGDGSSGGSDLLNFVFHVCLFCIPTAATPDATPLCSDPEARQAALQLLLALCEGESGDNLRVLLALVQQLNAALPLRQEWNYNPDKEARNATGFVGLKNQGATCYMNSLMQQFFMTPFLRNGLMAAEVPPPTPKALPPPPADPEDGKGEEGGKKEEEEEPADPKEVLRQVQRTFSFLRDGQIKYFNAKPLVDACKTLNLMNDVYQQNDARDFCDKLVDRLETCTKGTSQQRLMQRAFGGKVVHQTIRDGCPHKTEREEPFVCLEVQVKGKATVADSLSAFVEGERMEGENKVECEECGAKFNALRRDCVFSLPNVLILHFKRFDLDYRTFETIKLNDRCEFPDTLDMFPYTREALAAAAAAKSSPAGAEAAPAADGGEQAGAGEGKGGEGDDQEGVGEGKGEEGEEGEEPSPEALAAAIAAAEAAQAPTTDSTYQYALSGIVVHSGVAGGGHYYSYIKDRKSGLWFQFNDDRVSPFDAADIPEETFGGKVMRQVGGATVGSEVRMQKVDAVSNAYMVLYERLETVEVAADDDDAAADAAATGEDGGEGDGEEGATAASTASTTAADGEQAASPSEGGDAGDATAAAAAAALPYSAQLQQEVWAANEASLRLKMVYNADFFDFLRSLLLKAAGSGIGSPAEGEAKEGEAVTAAGEDGSGGWQVARTAAEFFLNVVLHSSVKAGSGSGTAGSGSGGAGAGVGDGTVKEWVSTLKALFSAYPAASRWLLTAVVGEKKQDWFIALLLVNRSAPMRAAFADLLAHAVSTLMPTEAELLTAATAELRQMEAKAAAAVGEGKQQEAAAEAAGAGGGDAGADADASEAASPAAQSLIVKLVTLQKLCLPAAGSVWRQFDAFFSLMGSIAAQEEVRDYMVCSHVADELLHFYLADKSPVVNREKYKSWTGRLNQWGYAIPGPNFASLLETLQTLVAGSCPEKPLPTFSVSLLSNITFYVSAFAEASNTPAVAAILSRFSVENEALSVAAVRALLRGLSDEWAKEPALQSVSAALAQLLAIPDSLQPLRLDTALGKDGGLLRTLQQKVAYARKFLSDTHAPRHVYRLIKMLLALHASQPAVAAWMEGHRADWLYLVDWLKDTSLRPALGGDRAKLQRQPSKIETLGGLARMGGLDAEEVLKIRQPRRAQVIDGILCDSNGDYVMGPRSLRRVQGSVVANMFTCAQASPVDGCVTTVNLCFSVKINPTQGHGQQWAVQVFNVVPDDLGRGGARDGTPLGDGEFCVGQRVTCLYRMGEVEKTACVLGLNDDGTFNVVYDAGGEREVMDRNFMSKLDNATAKPLPSDYTALELVSSTPLAVDVYSLDLERITLPVPIPIARGQVVGLVNREGKLGLAWNKSWAQTDPAVHSYFFTKAYGNHPGDTLYRIKTSKSRPAFNFLIRPSPTPVAQPAKVEEAAEQAAGAGGN